MRLLKLALAFGIVVITMNNCTVQKSRLFEPSYESLESYLLEIVNDTSVVYIPSLEIVDQKVYAVLDSVISSIENCDSYDKRIMYLYGAAIRPNFNEKDSGLYYELVHHRSIGYLLGIDDIYGGFYYKNHFFLVYNCFHIDETKIDFCRKDGCQLRMHLSKSYRLDSYSDYLRFAKFKGEYLIISNELCGPRIVID
jgi:hypothetical protein